MAEPTFKTAKRPRRRISTRARVPHPLDVPFEEMPDTRASAASTRADLVKQSIDTTPSITGLGATMRHTVDTLGIFFGNTPVIVPPPDYDAQWQVFNLDANTFSKLTPQALVSRLIELSPDISRALWDYLRLFNPGWTLSVFNPGSDAQSPKGQAYAESIMAKMTEMYGTVDVTHGRMAMSMFIRGALFTELVLAENAKDFVDFVIVDPVTVRFRRIQDIQRGQRFELGQMQVTGYVELDNFLTITYIPIDPPPDSPYGRPMISPAIFASLFLLGLLHDLRRVISQQGYPRIDLSVDLVALFDEAKKSMPQLVNNPAKYKAWVQGVFNGIKEVYHNLAPDDAYIHSGSVTVGRPVGTADPSSLGAIPAIIEIIERWLVRALKTMPLLMATRQTSSETQANREWEIHAAGIKSIQHYAEETWERQLQLALRAQGIQADVQFRYAELRAAEQMRDQQTMQILIANEFNKMAYGWQDNNASALAVTGHPALFPEPLYLPSGVGAVMPDSTDGQEAGTGPNQDGSKSEKRMRPLYKARDLRELEEAYKRQIDGIEYTPIRVLTHQGVRVVWRRAGTREIRNEDRKVQVA